MTIILKKLIYYLNIKSSYKYQRVLNYDTQRLYLWNKPNFIELLHFKSYCIKASFGYVAGNRTNMARSRDNMKFRKIGYDESVISISLQC